MFDVFCLFDDNGVIHIPKLQPRWMGGCVDGLDFKLFHEQVGNNGADGRSHGCLIHLFIILTLEDETDVFKAELQQYYDVLYQQECPEV